MRGCYDSVYDACFWRANRLANGKPLSSDSGQSIYLALSHFICKSAALPTAAQSITSMDVYKTVANGFLFVSFTLTTLLSQSDYLPTDLPLFYTRIEEYIAPAFD